MNAAIKCLSLYQPYATLLATFAKRIETRPRPWRYTGRVAIHAALCRDHLHLCETEPFRGALAALGYRNGYELPLGKVLAVGEMTGSVETEYIEQTLLGEYPFGMKLQLPFPFTAKERAFGNYGPKRYGYVFSSMKALPWAIPARGKQGVWLWTPPEGVDI